MTAQTNAQRQEALRAKREMLGLTEVRGIYLPPTLHPELKKLAKKLTAIPKENPNRLAKLVAEECAKLCEKQWQIDGSHTAREFADAIRAKFGLTSK